MNNHDLPRTVSRWGDDKEYRVMSAKALATMLHGMQGMPYVYQGEELGMTNIRLPIEKYRDLETLNLYHARKEQGVPEEEIMRSIYAKGRDNARTPMQWDDGENAGFTTGTPWLTVNENYHTINAKAALDDPDSVFHYYQKLIALRKQYPVFVHGDFTLLEAEHPQLFVYERSYEGDRLLVVCNLSGQQAAYALPQGWEDSEVLIANAEGGLDGTFSPWQAMILHKAKV